MNEYLIQLILKSSVILVTGAIVAAVLRRSSASARYTVWALTIVTVAALPLALVSVPAWSVAINAPRSFDTPTVSTPSSPVEPAAAMTRVAKPITEAVINATESVRTSEAAPSGISIVFLWLAGTLLVIARMCAGRYSLRRVIRRATHLTGPEWMTVLRDEQVRLGMQREILLLASDRVSSPLTTGIIAPVILLPEDRESWSDEHRHVVLRHELAHIARGDALVCLLSGIVCALHWFNPLAWVAVRRLRTEQERSCDDRVIALGTSAPDYADHLLEVARSARNIGMHSFVSVAMARPSQLEGRLLAVLRNHHRASLSRRHAVAATIVALIALTLVSALHPVRAESAIVVASQGDSKILGIVAPQLLPRPRVTEERSEAKQDAVADPDSVVDGQVAASSGGTLELDLKTGAGVRITGTDENRVTMHAELGGRDWRGTLVTIDNEGSGARIATWYRPNERITSSSHRMVITVPRRFNIHIKSAGGDVIVRNVEGTISGTTGGGEINIEGARGSAHLSTGGGPINVQNSRLSGSVSTGGGSVLIQGVTGGLRGSSGTGDVLYGGASSGSGITYSSATVNGARRGSDGRLYIRKSGGSVDLDDVPNGASIDTGGGDITIGASGGDVDASTGGGDVTIGRLSKGASITTGAGDVKVSVAGSGGHPIKVESGNGTVTLTLPSNFSADLELETAFTNNERKPTRIESDWPLATTTTPDWDAREGTPRRYVRASQSIGSGGAVIRVKTVNGNIIVKRR